MPMGYFFHMTTDTLDETEEEILNSTVCDEALEAAAGIEKAKMTGMGAPTPLCSVDPSVC
jgi:hypothetical protein